MATIKVKSLKKDLIIYKDFVIESGQVVNVDLSELSIRELRNLRYMHQLNDVEISKTDRSLLNTELYEDAGLSAAVSGGGSEVISVNGQTGVVEITPADLNVFSKKESSVITDQIALQVMNVKTTADSAALLSNTNKGDIQELTPKVSSLETAVSTVQSLSVNYDKVSKDKITLPTTTIGGVRDGSLTNGSKEAVNGGQLFTTNINVSSAVSRVSDLEPKVSTLTTKLESVETTLGSKANASDVATLSSTKADKTQITTLTTTKADKSEILKIVRLTQEEYDSLSEAEKNSEYKLYAITS